MGRPSSDPLLAFFSRTRRPKVSNVRSPLHNSSGLCPYEMKHAQCGNLMGLQAFSVEPGTRLVRLATSCRLDVPESGGPTSNETPSSCLGGGARATGLPRSWDPLGIGSKRGRYCTR